MRIPLTDRTLIGYSDRFVAPRFGVSGLLTTPVKRTNASVLKVTTAAAKCLYQIVQLVLRTYAVGWWGLTTVSTIWFNKRSLVSPTAKGASVNTRPIAEFDWRTVCGRVVHYPPSSIKRLLFSTLEGTAQNPSLSTCPLMVLVM